MNFLPAAWLGRAGVLGLGGRGGRGVPPPWSPAALFANGEVGGWYDPSNLSTLFQDSAGSIPVTAVGQTVGVMLDTGGNLALGAELCTNGTFDTDATGWTTASGATLEVIDGTARFYGDGAQSYPGIRYTWTAVVGRTYKVSFRFKGPGLPGAISFSVKNPSNNPLIVGVANNTTEWENKTVYYTALSTSPILDFYGSTAANATGYHYVDDVSIKEIATRPLTQLTASARPILRQDVNGNYYLEFDGVNDSIVTGEVDLSGTDKLTVIAGVYKTSNAAVARFLDATVAPLLSIDAPPYAGYSRYTLNAYNGSWLSITDTAAPIAVPNVLSGYYDLVEPRLWLRKDGEEIDSVTGNDGSIGVNFSSSKIFHIGKRNTPGDYYNGRMYQLVLLGASLSTNNLSLVENYIANKSGVTL
jgi:hypothetical protein